MTLILKNITSTTTEGFMMSSIDSVSSSLVDEYINNYGETKAKKSKPKAEIVLFDEATESDTFGDTMFSEVFGGLPSTGVDHTGTLYDPSDWDEEAQGFIPSMDKFEDYSPNLDVMAELWAAYFMKDTTMMVGPTGSGKSSGAEYFCAKMNIPFLRFNGSEATETSDLFGQVKIKEGSTVWEDGLLTKGMRWGAFVLMDEASSFSAGTWIGLHWVLEDGGKLYLADKDGTMADKTIDPEERSFICLADNTRGFGDASGHYAGTNVMNTAMIDRCKSFIYVDYPAKGTEENVLKNKYPHMTDKLSSYMLDVAHLIRKNYEQGEINLTMSTRTLLNWSYKALYYRDAKYAYQAVYVNKLPTVEERDAAMNHYTLVFGA